MIDFVEVACCGLSTFPLRTNAPTDDRACGPIVPLITRHARSRAAAERLIY